MRTPSESGADAGTTDLHRHVDPSPGYTRAVEPGQAGLRYLDFGLLVLSPPHPRYSLPCREREVAVVLLEGSGTVAVDGQGQRVEWAVGPRSNVFDALPWAVYAPPGATVSASAADGLVAVVVGAPADRPGQPALIRPDEVVVRTVGRDNWTRQVRTILDLPASQRLLVGETVNPPGNWSSYPPHKHDRDAPTELPMEEVYYYRLRPPQGFALQRVYTAPEDPSPLDACYVIRSGDLVALPRGFHPVVAAAGYELYYLWALSGARVVYGRWADDPAHAWIRTQEGADPPLSGRR
ncbi:MAG: 5-deoxy-glucuronate isomerase [Armatimonadota bacterium]|nr:5-deoxy-glucuronate isomerase [Armatimonadota bacterium]